MFSKLVKVVLVTLSFSICAFSQNLDQFNLYKVEIEARGSYERSIVANFIHIDDFYPDKVTATVNYNDLIALRRVLHSKVLFVSKPYNWVYELEKDGTNPFIYQFPKGDELYHTYSEVVMKLRKVATDFPKVIKLINLGSSYEGRDLLGIKMTLGGFENESKLPAMMMIGTHHAREHLSTEVPLLLIDEYLKLIKTDERFRNLLKTRVVYIVPLLNPDGALHDIQGGRYKMWRKNRRLNVGSRQIGVDLNRNYSFGWGTGGSSTNPGSDIYMGPKPFSENETLAVKRFVETHPNIKTMISFHTYSKLILYPWGGKNDGIGGKDEQVFKQIAYKMSEWNDYRPMQSSDLYVASGDTCDWAYGEHKIFCFTFELNPAGRSGGGFYPGPEMIDIALKSNINPTIYLLNLSNDPYKVLKDAPIPDPKPPGSGAPFRERRY